MSRRPMLPSSSPCANPAGEGANAPEAAMRCYAPFLRCLGYNHLLTLDYSGTV